MEYQNLHKMPPQYFHRHSQANPARADTGLSTTPKTILYLTPSVRLLGARQSLLALVRELDPRRYRPVVCCQSRGQLTEELDRLGVRVEIVRTGWWRKARYWPGIPLAVLRLRALIRRENVALIHCNEIYPTPFAVVAGSMTGTPVVTHMRLSVTPKLTRKYWLHRAERVVVVSNAAGDDFSHWPDKSSKVVTIYNGVDLEKYRLAEPREALRRELGLEPDDFAMGLIATWAHRKRQHVAVEAMARLAERVPRARLVLVGGAARSQSEYEAELRAQVEARGLRDRVHFIPFTEDIARIYNALDLNLLISGDEGFGRTIIEAATLGVPSIGAMAGGIPELIHDRQTGWLIPVDDPDALAARVEELAGAPESIRQAGEQARELVRVRFSIQKHTREMMALYDRVLREQERN